MLGRKIYCIGIMLLTTYTLPLPARAFQDYRSADYGSFGFYGSSLQNGWMVLRKLAVEGDGLRGPVQSVTITKAQLFSRLGEWLEGPEERIGTISYDTQGRRSEQADYSPTSSSSSHTSTFLYDSAGRLTEVIIHTGGKIGISNGAGQLMYLPADKKVTFAYDANGRLSEITEYETMGPGIKTVFAYGPHGNLTQVTTSGPRGNGRGWSYTSDGRNALIREQVHEKKNWLDVGPEFGPALVYTHDADENLVASVAYGSREAEIYNPAFARRTKYTYEYDDRGNWIKRTECQEYQQGTAIGQSACEPKTVLHRSIAYYGENNQSQRSVSNSAGVQPSPLPKTKEFPVGSYRMTHRAQLFREPRSGAETVTWLAEGMKIRVVGSVEGTWLRIESSHADRPPGYVRAEDAEAIQEQRERKEEQ